WEDGIAPTGADDVVFHDQSSSAFCVYSGTGSAPASLIKLSADYSGELRITNATLIEVNSIILEGGAIYMGQDDSDLTATTFSWSGGDLKTDAGKVVRAGPAVAGTFTATGVTDPQVEKFWSGALGIV